MITFAGGLDVLVLGLGGFFTVHVQRRATQGPSETLPCQLVMGLVLFFAGFFLPGAFGLYFVGRWVTIPNAVLVSLILVAAAGAWVRRHSPVATNVASASTRRMPPSPFG